MYREPAEDPSSAQEASAADGRLAVLFAIPRRRVRLGEVYATPAALHALNRANLEPADLLRRHALGDWGDVEDEDWKSNDKAALAGERLLSSYTLPTAEKVWIITECDRSATTLVLAEEY